MRDQLISDGYSLDFQHEFAFPVFCWELELDVSLPTALSASERAVLRLAGAGLGTTAEFAHALGFGPDVRLVADAATRLLERSALGIVDGRLAALESGRQMLAADLMLRRERVRDVDYRTTAIDGSGPRPSRDAADRRMRGAPPRSPGPVRPAGGGTGGGAGGTRLSQSAGPL